MAEHFNLDKLIYSDDRSGPLGLYLYGEDGRHSGKKWFSNQPRFPDEEISVSEARSRAERAMRDGQEVRICNGSDFLVFHAMGLDIICPLSSETSADDFWNEAAT